MKSGKRGSVFRPGRDERGYEMVKVRFKDLALVAFAGGLLAFEMVSIGEALPNVKKALADRGRSGRVAVTSLRATVTRVSALGTAGETAIPPMVAAVTDHVHLLAACAAKAPSERCVVVTSAGNGQHALLRHHVIKIRRDGSRDAAAAAQSQERLRDVEQAVDLALKHATL